MKCRAIKPKDYGLVLDLDRKVYPTASPVSKRDIRRWYIRNPEFGMIYEKPNKICGVCIVIPLNAKAWKRLINGNLNESEMNEKDIFNNSKDQNFGLHIYHIEKIKPSNDFHKTCLKDLALIINKLRIINRLRNTNKKLKLMGVSALCTSKKGIALFEKRLKFKERGYICSEHIVQESNQLGSLIKVVQLDKDADIADPARKKAAGCKILNRCKLLVIFPKEVSVIWKYIKNKELNKN